jgi:hypothetical protein
MYQGDIDAFAKETQNAVRLHADIAVTFSERFAGHGQNHAVRGANM